MSKTININKDNIPDLKDNELYVLTYIEDEGYDGIQVLEVYGVFTDKNHMVEFIKNEVGINDNFISKEVITEKDFTIMVKEVNPKQIERVRYVRIIGNVAHHILEPIETLAIDDLDAEKYDAPEFGYYKKEDLKEFGGNKESHVKRSGSHYHVELIAKDKETDDELLKKALEIRKEFVKEVIDLIIKENPDLFK